MAKKIFIDGASGTTGLKIFDRLSKRDDITLLTINDSNRRDISYRKDCINESDITFLCLPDNEAEKSISLLDVDNNNTIIIDTSSAHRINDNFTYGLCELDKNQRDKIKQSRFISNPGCHATGFITALNPLIKTGLVLNTSNIFSHSITGYSGGGKPLIFEYEQNNRDEKYKAPRPYATGLSHKHLPEMKKYTGLINTPIFNPILGDFYSGMAVSIPLFQSNFSKITTKQEVFKTISNYYVNDKLIEVCLDVDNNIIEPTELSGKDNMKIYVVGNDEFIEIISVFDNLGKGASGSAIMCMNIILGVDETTGLNI